MSSLEAPTTTSSSSMRPRKRSAAKPHPSPWEKAGIVCNYNTIPYDTRKPFDPSGIRIGTPAITTRGMKEDEAKRIVAWIDEAITHALDDSKLAAIKEEVAEFLLDLPCTLLLEA